MALAIYQRFFSASSIKVPLCFFSVSQLGLSELQTLTPKKCFVLTVYCNALGFGLIKPLSREKTKTETHSASRWGLGEVSLQFCFLTPKAMLDDKGMSCVFLLDVFSRLLAKKLILFRRCC